MTPDPLKTTMEEHDQALVAFLQAYQPQPPAPAVDLEERILHQLEPAMLTTPSPRSPRALRQRQSSWLAISAVVAGLAIALWWGQKTPETPALSRQQTQELEAFLVDNWHGSVHPSQYETTSF